MLVMRTDNRYDYVHDSMLDSLIQAKQIVKFKRNAEWVNIGTDPIRGSKRDTVFDGANGNRLEINDSIFVRKDRMANP
jgi:hypothetical protein